MPVVKTIIEVWGGDEPLDTKYGPIHYIMCRFAEDDEKTASVGCKPENVNKVRRALHDLIEVPAEFTLELNNNGNYRIKDYAGKHGSDLKVVGNGGGGSRASSPHPLPTATHTLSDEFATILELLAEVDAKLERLLAATHGSKSAVDLVKEVLDAEDVSNDMDG